MSIKIKDISVNNHTYYFFDNIINSKNFYPNKIKIDKKYSYLLHWICDNQRFEICKN